MTTLATDYDAMDEGAFRAMLRAFIHAECTPNLRFQGRRVRWPEIAPWMRALSARGWLAPAWPVAHGGMGLGPAKLVAYHDEFDSAGVARGPELGIVMLGMLLIRHGTPAQQAHYLPRILRCEDLWCQGYSEPGAGSDLAALRTRAVRDGDHWVIDGQKTWTTVAQDSTDIFLLVRTDPAAPRHAGISFLLARMDTPGITVRPIRTLAGEDEFCEVFFDQVRVPAANIVGQPNQGWSMAKALLGFERITIGSPKAAQVALRALAELGRRTGACADAAFRDQYTRLHLDVADHVDNYERFAAVLKQGGTLGPEVSVLKIWVSETQQRITEYMLEVAQEYAAVMGPSPIGGDAGGASDPLGFFWVSRPTTIYGGANEIQKNILAKAVLGLGRAR
ncbi:acyl-CoA dehydrogenase family protein [Pseudorhodoferax sp.]|uniref:acyl-CoA dehydrogenase family protein n=1 Tax=Pseudorhodoferax sp. TaxID=1993553 RepID=UPI002DD69270|nr:acyl-CoA dehydrogenase family protein [Pseudorhodoferax sp.]